MSARVFGPLMTAGNAQVPTFGISSIPTLMVIRDGVILYAQPGAVPAAVLEQLIAEARELDMNDVRARIAERSEPAAADA
jgi:thioredoxin 1